MMVKAEDNKIKIKPKSDYADIEYNGRVAVFSGDFVNDGFRAFANSMRWVLPRSDRQLTMEIKSMNKNVTDAKSILGIAIQDCMTIGPLENWNFSPEYKRDKKIVEKYGKDILSKIIEIERFLDTIESPRRAESLKSFCRRVSRIVKKQYPSLEDESVNVLTTSVAYPYCK